MRDLVSDLTTKDAASDDTDFHEELRRIHERKKKRWMLDAFFYLLIGVTFMMPSWVAHCTSLT